MRLLDVHRIVGVDLARRLVPAWDGVKDLFPCVQGREGGGGVQSHSMPVWKGMSASEEASRASTATRMFAMSRNR